MKALILTILICLIPLTAFAQEPKYSIDNKIEYSQKKYEKYRRKLNRKAKRDKEYSDAKKAAKTMYNNSNEYRGITKEEYKYLIWVWDIAARFGVLANVLYEVSPRMHPSDTVDIFYYLHYLKELAWEYKRQSPPKCYSKAHKNMIIGYDLCIKKWSQNEIGKIVFASYNLDKSARNIDTSKIKYYLHKDGISLVNEITKKKCLVGREASIEGSTSSLRKTYRDLSKSEKYNIYMRVTDVPAGPKGDRVIADMARKYNITESDVLQVLSEGTFKYGWGHSP